jgi:enoyl-CoA hydratase/carnithine racemase
VILTGAGRAFSAGADLSGFGSSGSDATPASDRRPTMLPLAQRRRVDSGER